MGPIVHPVFHAPIMFYLRHQETNIVSITLWSDFDHRKRHRQKGEDNLVFFILSLSQALNLAKQADIFEPHFWVTKMERGRAFKKSSLRQLLTVNRHDFYSLLPRVRTAEWWDRRNRDIYLRRSIGSRHMRVTTGCTDCKTSPEQSRQI
jgi:hypothetical protein